MPFSLLETAPGVKPVLPQECSDSRGFFMAACREREFNAGALTTRFARDTHSFSSRAALREAAASEIEGKPPTLAESSRRGGL